jgi:hypothetical protein
MLTKEQYAELKRQIEAESAWVDSIRSRRKCQTCNGSGKARWNQGACAKCEGKGYRLGWASYKPEDKPADVPTVSNADRSSVEVYEFCQNPPERYFLYISFPEFGKPAIATTWTGERLGAVTFGQSFRSPFGDKRVPVRIKAINGKDYAGTYYSDAGSYARVKMCKA